MEYFVLTCGVNTQKRSLTRMFDVSYTMDKWKCTWACSYQMLNEDGAIDVCLN